MEEDDSDAGGDGGGHMLIPLNRCLPWKCHGDFTVVRGEYLVKGKKIRKGMEGRNDSQCLFLLLLAFALYKELYSLGIFMCIFLFLSSFIGAD